MKNIQIPGGDGNRLDPRISLIQGGGRNLTREGVEMFAAFLESMLSHQENTCFPEIKPNIPPYSNILL